MNRLTRGVALWFTVALLVAAAGCGSQEKGNPLAAGNQSGTITVGSANFPENALLAEIYAQAIRGKGLNVVVKANIGSREVIYSQLQSGGLTLVPEYNGALLLTSVDPASTASTTAQVNQALKDKLPPALNILDSSPAQDKDVLTVTRATAEKYQLRSIGDLGPHAKDFLVGGPPEFKTRVQGLVGLKDRYGLDFKDFTSLDTQGPITVAALKRDDIQIADLTSTDSAIAANDFVVLDDSQGLFGVQNVTPLVYRAGLNPAAIAALNAVSAKLDTDTLAQLDKRVVVDKDGTDTVAADWLRSVGLG
jgi:osmoprotectant transport system substrate-binding protein